MLSDVDGVVHTLGTLLEGGAYKKAVREGNALSVFASLLQARFGDDNPLKRGVEGTYDSVNRDSGMLSMRFLSLCTNPPVSSSGERMSSIHRLCSPRGQALPAAVRLYLSRRYLPAVHSSALH